MQASRHLTRLLLTAAVTFMLSSQSIALAAAAPVSAFDLAQEQYSTKNTQLSRSVSLGLGTIGARFSEANSTNKLTPQVKQSFLDTLVYSKNSITNEAYENRNALVDAYNQAGNITQRDTFLRDFDSQVSEWIRRHDSSYTYIANSPVSVITNTPQPEAVLPDPMINITPAPAPNATVTPVSDVSPLPIPTDIQMPEPSVVPSLDIDVIAAPIQPPVNSGPSAIVIAETIYGRGSFIFERGEFYGAEGRYPGLLTNQSFNGLTIDQRNARIDYINQLTDRINNYYAAQRDALVRAYDIAGETQRRDTFLAQFGVQVENFNNRMIQIKTLLASN